jgi:hypothetical protein
VIWQNLVLAFIGGWLARAWSWRIVRRMKQGDRLVEAVMPSRRVPRVTEVP